jgi:endophilin-A
MASRSYADRSVVFRSGSSNANRPRSKSTSAVPKAMAPVPSRTTSSSRLSSMLGGGRPSLPSRQNSSKPTSDEDGVSTKGNRDRAFSNASTGSKKEKRSSFIPKFGSMGKKTAASPAGGKERYGSLDDREGLRNGSEHEVGRLSSTRDVEDTEEDSEDERYGRRETYSRPVPAGRARSHSDLSGGQPRFVAGVGSSGSSTPPIRRNNTNTIPVHHTIAESRESHEGGRTLRRVLFDYQGKAADELTIRVGDVVEVTRTVSADWCIGENERGESGLFPSTYTEPFEESSSAKRAAPALPSRSSSTLAIPIEGSRRAPPIFGAPMPSSRSPGPRLAPPILTHPAFDTETDEDPFN